MSLTLYLSATAIDHLDLTPGRTLVTTLLQNPQAAIQQVQCVIDYPRAPEDPRELSEIPEIRLWFVRFDSFYPWMPYFLDWRAGELTRYCAMLVPHQFSAKDGIQFNNEALELFIMQKVFVLQPWLQDHQMGGSSDLRNLAQTLGYEIAPEFFQLLEQYP